MKKTIKQWCKEHEINWLGQGNISNIRYDWKLVLGKGRVAIFLSSVTDLTPEIHTIKDREILLFPNINKSKNNGKISESAFQNLLAWVDECLNGNLSAYGSQNKVIEATK